LLYGLNVVICSDKVYVLKAFLEAGIWASQNQFILEMLQIYGLLN